MEEKIVSDDYIVGYQECLDDLSAVMAHEMATGLPNVPNLIKLLNEVQKFIFEQQMQIKAIQEEPGQVKMEEQEEVQHGERMLVLVINNKELV